MIFDRWLLSALVLACVTCACEREFDSKAVQHTSSLIQARATRVEGDGCPPHSFAPLPTPRLLLAAAAGADGRIYAIGGADGYQPGPVSTVEAYNPTTDSWETLAPLRTARSLLGAAAGPDGRIYAAGGEPDFDAHTVRSVEVYDPSTNRWAAVAPMPTARAAPVMATGSDGRIYVIGGVDWAGVPRRMFFVDAVEAYDPETDSWETLAPLPTPRWSPAGAADADGQIYVVGGMFNSAVQGTVEAYRPDTDAWSAIIALPTPRLALAAAATPDGRLFAIGGVNQDIEYSDVVEAYSPGDGSGWARMAPIPTARGWFAAATGADGRMYAVGGRGNTEYAPLAALEVYDPTTNCW